MGTKRLFFWDKYEEIRDEVGVITNSAFNRGVRAKVHQPTSADDATRLDEMPIGLFRSLGKFQGADDP